MKQIKIYVISIFAVLFMNIAQAADDSVLWQTETFVAPYANNVVAISPVILNNNEFYPAIKISLEYLEILPLGCDCKVSAVLEEEVAPGVWRPLGYQFSAINSGLHAKNRDIVITPDINFNEGSDMFVSVGDGTLISRSQGNVPDRIRVVIYNQDTGLNVLQSVKLTGYSRLYN